MYINLTFSLVQVSYYMYHVSYSLFPVHLLSFFICVQIVYPMFVYLMYYYRHILTCGTFANFSTNCKYIL